MRKLLILMLVLGLVSTASATLKELWVAPGTSGHTAPDESAYYDETDNTVDMIPCTYLWVGIRNSEAGSEEVGTGQETMYLALDANTNGEWTKNYTMGYMTDHPTQWANIYQGPKGIGDTWKAMLSTTEFYFVPVGIMDAKEFHCKAEGNVTVTLYGEGEEGYVSYDSFVIHQVPEPMTLALLGLGGLLLRRRK